MLPLAKGEAVIIAKRRARVGVNDPDELSRQIELQARIRKLAGQFTKPLDYAPSAFEAASSEPEAPKATQVIHPSEFMAAQEPPEPEPPDFPEISSMEWQARQKPRAIGFADLED